MGLEIDDISGSSLNQLKRVRSEDSSILLVNGIASQVVSRAWLPCLCPHCPTPSAMGPGACFSLLWHLPQWLLYSNLCVSWGICCPCNRMPFKETSKTLKRQWLLIFLIHKAFIFIVIIVSSLFPPSFVERHLL